MNSDSRFLLCRDTSPSFQTLHIQKHLGTSFAIKRIMTTLIAREENYDANGVWAILVVVLLTIIGLGIAYFNGAYSGLNGKFTMEPNTTINKTITVPASTP
jgi:hypothetical protein